MIIDYKFNVLGSIGGLNSEIIIIDRRNVERYEGDFLVERNNNLDMVLVSDENSFVLFSNEELSDERVKEIVGGEFFEEGYEVIG